MSVAELVPAQSVMSPRIEPSWVVVAMATGSLCPDAGAAAGVPQAANAASTGTVRRARTRMWRSYQVLRIVLKLVGSDLTGVNGGESCE